MYRAEAKEPTCAMCGSVHISPETHFEPTEGVATMHFVLRDPPTGWLADPRLRLRITRARACLDCGHVALFLSPKRREELRQAASGLLAIPPDGP